MGGLVECFPFEADLERVLDRSFIAAVRPSDCCLLGLDVGDRLWFDPDLLISIPLEGDGDRDLEESRSLTIARCPKLA